MKNRIGKRVLALLAAAALLLGLSFSAYAAESGGDSSSVPAAASDPADTDEGLEAQAEGSGSGSTSATSYSYTTKGFTAELLETTTDSATGVTTTTYGYDTNGDGAYDDIKLVITGNEWTYYFNVADATATYYITEILNNSLGTTYTLENENGEQQAYLISKDGKTVTLYNVADGYGLPDYGGLTITKKVVDESTNVTTSTDSFSFDVELNYAPEYDADGNIVGTDLTSLLSGSQTYGDVIFTWSDDVEDGSDAVKTASARVTVKAGETVTLSDIPEGVSYSVTEVKVPSGYSFLNWSADGTNSQDKTIAGTIEADKTAALVCTNEQEPDNPPPPGDDKDYGALVVKKVVQEHDGAAVTDNTTAFSFRVSFGALKTRTEYSYTVYDADGSTKETGTFTTDVIGGADVSLTLGNGQYAKFTGLPEGSTYQVLETGATGYTASYEVEADIPASSRGESFTEGEDLSTGNETVDSDELGDTATVTFTNTKPETIPEDEVTEVTVKKDWLDDDTEGQTSHKGERIAIYLYQVTSLEDLKDEVTDECVATVYLDGSEDTPWEYTFTDLELYQSSYDPDDPDTVNDIYYYFVKEEPIDGYNAGYQVTMQPDVNGEDDYTQPYTITVTNGEAVELPLTGGMGTALYTMGGTALFAAALVYGYERRRRERRHG